MMVLSRSRSPSTAPTLLLLRLLLLASLLFEVFLSCHAVAADSFGLPFVARGTVGILSAVMSFVRIARRLLVLLDPTTGIFRLLRGRRSLEPRRADFLRQAFDEAARHDTFECVPLILCAIHADPEELVTPKESAFRRVFRSIFPEEPIPSWAKNYVEASIRGSTKNSTQACQEAYPSCIFPSHHLRKLVDIALEKGKYLTQR